MKQVFPNNELPHVWASQSQQSGRNPNGSFYFNGRTIYSYGSHFPIATINGNDVFFTVRSYSNTTAKHISKSRSAVSHKNFIMCYEVPTNFDFLTSTHEQNLNYWKKQINALFLELGNKKIRNTESRVNSIQYNIGQLEAYCAYFKLPITDKELKSLLKMAAAPDFIEQARKARDKKAASDTKKMKQAEKAAAVALSLWRMGKDEQLQELPEDIKALVRHYQHQQSAFTHLRYNAENNRVETSKGVQIPAEIAHRAFFQLKGCMQTACTGLEIPVMQYTITETGKDYIKAGCHTIPKTDIQYIANLLGW